MSELITYDDKIRLKSQNVSEKYKVTAEDMNEIKRVVNTNATEGVSVGSEAPTDGRRVWFKKGKNLYNNALISANLNKARTTITYENEQIVMRTTGADAYFGNIVSVGNSWSVQYGQLISVEPNTNYTLSITNNVVDKNFITYYDENKVSIKIDYNQPYQVTFTTPNNAKYVSFRFGTVNSTSNGVYKFNIQLEKGSTATTYEPYVEEGIYVDKKEWYSKPKALYENMTGIAGSSSGTQITLNDNINNYSKIEVTLGVSKSECNTYILPIWESAKTVSVFLAGLTYYFRFRIEANNNTLTFTEISMVGWSAGTSKLFRVVGYK